MDTIIVTGAAGLIGSETVRYFAGKGHRVIGIDNDMRAYFFGQNASTAWKREHLIANYPTYHHADIDIRNYAACERLFLEHSRDIALIVHTAAQPSHDWAAREPLTDFAINANGTHNLLELTRLHAPKAVFVFLSTNKVYGDTPNRLPLVEQEMRWEVEPGHAYAQHGIDEKMSIDASTHSLFGVSKCAADLLVQEYGRYFGMKTACLRGGCLTGPSHSGAELHGFLSYLVQCAVTGRRYTIFGYKGKQVRDNIHSYDLVSAIDAIFRNPPAGEAYNIGGGRTSNCSLLEAIAIAEELTGKPMNKDYQDGNRIGDHIWWISDLRKFKSAYPEWQLTYDVPAIMREIFVQNVERWQNRAAG